MSASNTQSRRALRIRRWFPRALAALLLAAAGLASACGPKSSDEPTPAAQADGERRYEPLSKTAEAFSGGLRVRAANADAAGALTLVTETGSTYEARLIGAARPSDSIGLSPWTSFAPLPPDAKIDVYEVQSESLAPGAPNGGFCAPNKTHILALAAHQEAGGKPVLLVAAFSDTSWPPKRAPSLCGTFLFGLAEGQ